MCDDLRMRNLIPTQSPYYNNSNYPSSTYGIEMLNRDSIMEIKGQDAIIDWVFLELRDPDDANILISARSALLTRHGELRDVDGISPIYFPLVPHGLYYVVIKHRNHLPMMSSTPIMLDRTLTLYDFSREDSYKNGGVGQKEIINGLWAMIAGDIEPDQNGSGTDQDINGEDKSMLSNQNGEFSQYLKADFNMNGGVNGVDKILWSNNNGLFSNVP